jgi:import inner membrane translocase subunit TIM13
MLGSHAETAHVQLALSFACAKAEMEMNGDRVDMEGTKRKVQNELAAAALQDLFQKITDKCYVKCVAKPSPKLDNNDQTCLAKCMDRYLDTMTVVSQTMATRSQQSSME